MTNLKKFCIFTPLRVLAISAVLALIAAYFVAEKVKVDSRETMYLMIYPLLIGYNVVLSLASYSIFANIYRSVAYNFILSFLSFYVPVILFSIGVSLFAGGSGLLGLPMMSIPFLIPQTYYFVQFRRRLKTKEFDLDFIK